MIQEIFWKNIRKLKIELQQKQKFYKKYQMNYFPLKRKGGKEINKIPLAPMEVLAPGSTHARPYARPPIDTSGNLSAHMSGGGEIV